MPSTKLFAFTSDCFVTFTFFFLGPLLFLETLKVWHNLDQELSRGAADNRNSWKPLANHLLQLAGS
jgi:hypothetical protein